MAISSPINIQNVSGSIRSLKLGLNRAKQSAGGIKTAILNRTIFKRQAIAGKKVLQNRRTENIGRRDQEDILEATGISGVFKRAGSVATESAKGFLGRILDFITTMLVGWLLYNLPTILTMVKDLIKRVQSLFSLLQGFIFNVGKVFGDFGNIFNGVLYNVTHLDFLDSQKKVQTAMNGLESTFDDFHNQFEEGFKLLTTPLGEGKGEEPIPPTGTDYTTPTGGTTGSAGQWKPLLNLIASGEAKGGSYESMNPNTYLPGATKMTIAEVDRKATGAVGRYQFMTPSKQARNAGLDPNKDLFSPENQDKMAVALIEKTRGGKKWLSGKMTDAEFSEGLSNEWGALRSASGNVLPGNSGSIGFNKIKPILQQVKYSSSSSNPLVQASNISQGSGRISPASTSLVDAAKSLKGMSTKNAATSGGTNGCVYAVNAVFKAAGIASPWGNALRVSNAEAAMIKSGWKEVPLNQRQAGDVIIIYDRDPTEPQIHIGIVLDNGKMISNSSSTGTFTWEDYPENVFKTYSRGQGYGKCYRMPGNIRGGGVMSSPMRDASGRLASANILSTSGQQQNIQPTRRGQQIVYIDDRQPTPPPIRSGGGGGQAFPQSVPEDGLNSLIKMQMLLDLAYT